MMCSCVYLARNAEILKLLELFLNTFELFWIKKTDFRSQDSVLHTPYNAVPFGVRCKPVVFHKNKVTDPHFQRINNLLTLYMSNVTHNLMLCSKRNNKSFHF